MFYGTIKATLDDKNRLRIPVRFREKLGEKFLITAGTGGCLFVMSEPAMEELLTTMAKVPLSAHAQQDAVRKITSKMSQPEEDSQFRFILPQDLRAYSGINKKVVFLGVMNRIEIWSEDAFEEKYCGKESIDDAVSSLAEYGV